MGLVADKAVLEGLFGGVKNGMKNGKNYISVISVGPVIDKVECSTAIAVPEGLPFGFPVRLELVEAEQAFKDFNGSFNRAKTVTVIASKK